MGKHIDKLPWDAAADVKTLPVMLGETRARRVTNALMIGFYIAIAACVLVDALPWPVLASFGALPLLMRALKALATVVRGVHVHPHPPRRSAARNWPRGRSDRERRAA
jgi:1,4-dihydroxy-2-naphthoate octaprenyltransferase